MGEGTQLCKSVKASKKLYIQKLHVSIRTRMYMKINVSIFFLSYLKCAFWIIVMLCLLHIIAVDVYKLDIFEVSSSTELHHIL